MTVAQMPSSSTAAAPLEAQLRRASWPGTLAAMVAMGALYVQMPGHFPGLVVLAVLLLLTHFVTWRLPARPTLVWPVRLLLFGLVLAANSGRPMTHTVWYLNTDYSASFGYLCAAELVLRSWYQPAHGDPYGRMLVLSALILLSATNSFQRQYIHYFAATYTVLVAVWFRDFRPPMVSMAVGVSERRWRGRALRWFALVLALGSGLGMATALENWGDQAARWAMDRLIGRPPVNAVGMSNAPQLGLSVDPSASASRVLRIEGPVRDGHLRGAAFDTYAQRRWLPPVDQRTYRPIDAQQLRPQVPGVRRLTVTRLADELELVYAPLSAAGVVVPQDSDMQVDNTGGFTLLGDAESGQGEYRYEVVCARDEDFQGPLCVPPTREQLARCLHVPQDLDPRVRELARPFMKEREPLRRIFAITSFLGTNNSYSLRVAETPGEPISDFLLNKRAGYCQYFASAAVVLLRLSGLPARYVSGYYAHESAGENITIVRQRDAHAWAECWVEGVGWVTVEATPADGRPDQTQPPATSWRKLWEWTQDQWRALRQRLAAANLRELVVVVPCAAVLVLCAQLVRGMIRRRRMTRRATEYAYPTEELAVLARRFQALLVRWGLPCPESRTWQEHLTADAHGDENGAAGQLRDRLLARQFVEEYSAIRFGRAGDPAVAAAGLRYLLDQLQQPNGSGAGGAGGGVAAPSARCPLMQLQVVEVGARRDARDAGDSEDLP